MAVVRFLLAVSNCLMSLVISFTMLSLSPALFLMSLTSKINIFLDVPNKKNKNLFFDVPNKIN
jgi:hypothetical protein